MSVIDNALQALFKMAHKEKLWENASPGSSFGAQQIAVSGSEFAFYEIHLNQSYMGNTYNIVAIMPTGGNAQAEFNAASTASAYPMLIVRSILSTKTAVNFDNSDYKYTNSNSVSTQNSNLIPTKIYGGNF